MTATLRRFIGFRSLVHAGATAQRVGYAIGWCCGIAVSTEIFVLISVFLKTIESTPRWLSWVVIALGAGLTIGAASQSAAKDAFDVVTFTAIASYSSLA